AGEAKGILTDHLFWIFLVIHKTSEDLEADTCLSISLFSPGSGKQIQAAGQLPGPPKSLAPAQRRLRSLTPWGLQTPEHGEPEGIGHLQAAAEAVPLHSTQNLITERDLTVQGS
uniref:Uncharacterized protein n=1 Tax=Pongo abelii TaxID=9601 RepID=A0A8I5UP07_PONAB